jgi:hypothetical protein
MTSAFRMLVVVLIFGSGFTGFGFSVARAQNASVTPTPQTAQGAASKSSPKPDPDVPAYHASQPRGPLPETLDPNLFSDAETQNLYALAAKEKSVLYQLPCYCRCDKEVGHKSLLDCYVDYHAAHCVLCKKEAAFAYTETQAGKTAAQIRKEIMDGKWKQVDLSQYDALPPVQ